MSRWRSRDTVRFLVVVGALALLSLIVIYGNQPDLHPIRSDGMGYYAYLPQVLIRQDPTFSTLPPEIARLDPRALSRFRKSPATQRYLDKYQLGEAVLLLPFFGAGHLVALVSGAPRTGFSWPYQSAVAVAAVAYLLLGVACVSAILRDHFSRSTVMWTLVAVVFATNLFHYATFDGVFSHVYSFASFCLLLVLARRWVTSPDWACTVGLAVVAGLFVLIRATNAMLLVAIAVFVVHRIGDWRELYRRRLRVLSGGALFAVVLVPQALMWKLTTDQWLVNSYGGGVPGDRLDLLRPHILEVLFSVRKGLLFWSPVIAIAVAGLWSLRRRDRGLAVGAAIVLPLYLYVVSSWETWSFGGSFGHRAFVETLPLFAFGYAAIVETSGATRRRVLAAVTCVLVILSSALMIRYWQGLIPYDGATWRTVTGALVGKGGD